MKTIRILGDSHTRAFAHRANIFPYFLGVGKRFNLSTEGLELIKRYSLELIDTFGKDDLLFMSFGEPNCREMLGYGWAAHEVKEPIKPKFDAQTLQQMVLSYAEMVQSVEEMTSRTIRIITPTTAFEPTLFGLNYLRYKLLGKFQDKCIDVFTETVDPTEWAFYVKEEFKNENFAHDPIHLNKKLCDVFLDQLCLSKIIETPLDYPAREHIPHQFGVIRLTL